jgi:hypothetical protein
MCRRLDLRSVGARVAEPRGVERIGHSIERGGQIVPCVAVADRPVEVLQGGEGLVLIDGDRRIAALRRLGRDTRGSNAGRGMWPRRCSASWRGVRAVHWWRSKKLCWFVDWSRGCSSRSTRSPDAAGTTSVGSSTTAIACGASWRRAASRLGDPWLAGVPPELLPARSRNVVLRWRSCARLPPRRRQARSRTNEIAENPSEIDN